MDKENNRLRIQKAELTESVNAAKHPTMIRHHPLRRWRFDHGMSLEALSTLSGVPRASIQDIETFKYSPRGTTIAALARVTGLPAEAFLPMEEKAS